MVETVINWIGATRHDSGALKLLTYGKVEISAIFYR